MTAAAGTHPELIGCPRRTGSRVSHLHVGAATLAADTKLTVRHACSVAGNRAPGAGTVYSICMVSAMVLAAGFSTRMGGRSKALLPVGEDTFVTRIVRTFADAGIEDIVVVVGHQANEVRRVVEQSGLPARVVVNAAFAEGQFSSVRAGLDALDRPGVDGVLMALVDAPLFSADTVRRVVQRFDDTRAPIVRAVRGADHGHPVLIGRSLFEALRRADPAFGAKPIVRANVSPAGDVEVDDPGAFIDVDTPEEYARFVAGTAPAR